MTDLHDRDFPVALGARSTAYLDLSRSELSDRDALTKLGRLSDKLALGLVRVSPDLAGDQSRQVFVTVGTSALEGATIPRFGDQPSSQVKGSSALSHSYASGQYLITGPAADRRAFGAWLRDHRIFLQGSDDTVTTTLRFLWKQGSFAAALLAAAALMVALVLYWLAVKAKGRALRTLGGAPVWRVQTEDVVGFLVPVVAAAAACLGVATVWLGLAAGWRFVPWFAHALVVVEALVLVVAGVAALAMSAVSWPSVAALAARTPAVGRLRTGSGVLKAVTFALVVAAAAPAYTAYTAASATATQQARWRGLADQVGITFPGALGESGFQRVQHNVGSGLFS